MNKVFWLFISALFSVPLLIGSANERRLSHWAWQPLQVTQNFKSSLDSFIEEKLKKNGLKVSSEPTAPSSADLPTICMVPPPLKQSMPMQTTDQMRLWKSDQSGHPRFGERMAQHWWIWLIMRTRIRTGQRRPNAGGIGIRHQIFQRGSPPSSSRSRLLETPFGGRRGCQRRYRFSGCRALGFRRTSGNRARSRRSARAVGRHGNLCPLTQAVSFQPARCTITNSTPSPRRNTSGKRSLRREQTGWRTISEVDLKAYEKESSFTKELDDAQHELAQSLGKDSVWRIS